MACYGAPVIDELLEKLATFGAIGGPRVSDLEEVVGPIFVDVDDRLESTTEIHRPHAFAKGPFLFASIHGRHCRITKNDPVAVGTKKIVLRDDGTAALMPDEQTLDVGFADRIEGKHVEIRSHRGWTDETGFTPLVRRLSLRMRHDSLEPVHRRDDREIGAVNFVLASPFGAVLHALSEGRAAAKLLDDGRHALHPFYVSPIRADRTRVEWYSEVPSLGRP